MGGEKSKTIGEYGEKIARELFKLIGWQIAQQNIEVPCHDPNLHKTKSNNKAKKSHGLDFLIRYKCPLCLNTQKTISISMKYRNNYKSKSSSELKTFIEDLGNTMHCLTLDSSLGISKIDKSLSIIEHIGLLIYLTQDDDKNTNIFEDLPSIRNTDKIKYKPIFVIDNHIATFIYSAISDIREINRNFNFAYSNTDLNVGSTDFSPFGKLLPIEFLISGLLPLEIGNSKGKELYLYSLCNFTQDNFESLLHFSLKFTNGWATAITIKFPNYNERKYRNDVSEILSKHQSDVDTKKIKVLEYTEKDFRELENK